MSQIGKEIIRGAVLGFLIPALMVSGVVLAVENTMPQQAPPSQSTTGAPQITSPTTTNTQPSQPKITIPVLVNGEVVSMDLETYILGVVLSEMPASFEMEALKAQAVAARTFAMKIHTDGYKHDAGAVCTSYACCQGYLTPENYLDRGWSSENIRRVTRAVEATAGLVLTYEGALVSATYFACSGGSTESAQAVWGQDVPYLQAVESPGEEETVYYSQKKQFTPEEFQKALGVTLVGSVESWFGMATMTAGGGVDTMLIGDVPYRGTTLRALLGLRSTAFSVTVSQGMIVFHTRGYGHRVGMSQYGADAMALTGSDYIQILAHYYPGTSLVQCSSWLY